jgi:catalase
VLTCAHAVDAIEQRYGAHPGARRLHAKGTLCRGTFTPTAAAAELTRAGIFAAGPVPATVRFSNGGGNPAEPDFVPDVRGLAVKLYGGDGDKLDISAQTSPRFPTRTVDAFIELVGALAPAPSMGWRLPRFLAHHPRAAVALAAGAPALRPPASYAGCRYAAIHAFRWVDAAGGERYVRYTWRPAVASSPLSLREARRRGADYLQEDLAERLRGGPVTFTLDVQIAAPQDPTDDPTAVWPPGRATVDVGTLAVTALETTRETGGDIVVFDPARVPDGIELSDDPILRARSRLYSESIERRAGVPRPARLDGT